MTRTLTDWRSIENDREKYAAYLCSREWAVLKEAVHKRATWGCERCQLFPIDAVHHLTYERKYHEELADLAGWCNHCHEFTHGKSDFNPLSFPVSMRRYFHFCKYWNRIAAPVEYFLVELYPEIKLLEVAIKTLRSLQWGIAARLDDEPVSAVGALQDALLAIESCLPFDLTLLDEWYERSWDESEYATLRSRCGFPEVPLVSFSKPYDEEEN